MAPVNYPRVRAFVQDVMRRLDVKNARQLADALGMDDIDRESRARRWVNGRSAPKFEYAMLILSAAGYLTPEGEQAWAESAQDPAVAARAASEAAAEAEARAEQARRAAQPRRKRGTG